MRRGPDAPRRSPPTAATVRSPRRTACPTICSPTLTATVERLIADNPGVRPEALAGAHVRSTPTRASAVGPELLEFARDPDLLDMVAELLGPDLIVWGSHVFAKPAGTGQAVPWHQDGGYWGHIRPLEALTAWIAIDPADARERVPAGRPRIAHPGCARPRRVRDDPDLALNLAVDATRGRRGLGPRRRA